ncbi:MAG TPA: hypothetical protein VJ283_10340, partial [Trebonia sp.]|nr:hypothetical protein [Trebonia sp.]
AEVRRTAQRREVEENVPGQPPGAGPTHPRAIRTSIAFNITFLSERTVAAPGRPAQTRAAFT